MPRAVSLLKARCYEWEFGYHMGLESRFQAADLRPRHRHRDYPQSPIGLNLKTQDIPCLHVGPSDLGYFHSLQ